MTNEPAPVTESLKVEGVRKLDGTVAGGIAWTAGAKAATQLLTWASTLIAARLLSPADFGIVGMAGLFSNFLSVLSEFGLGTAALQMPELDSNVLKQLNAAAPMICTLVYGVAALSAPLVAAFFKSDQLKLLVVVNSFGLVIIGFQSVPTGLLQKDLDYRRLSFIEATQALVMAAGTVSAALMGYAYWSLVVGATAGRFAALCLTYWWKPVGFKFPRWKDIEAPMRLGMHVAVGRIAAGAYLVSDGIVVGKMLGESALGAYQLALALASAPADKIGALLMRVTGPLFAKIQTDTEAIRRYFRTFSESLSLSIMPMMFGLAVVAPEAVRLLLGPKWMAAVGPIRWLALFMGVRDLSVLVSQVLTSLRYTRFIMWMSVLGAVLMPAAFVAASHWGLSAVAASWVILAPVTLLPLLVKLMRTIGFRYRDYFEVLTPAVIGSITMALAVLALRVFLNPHDIGTIPKLAVQMIVGAAVYAGFLQLFYRERLHRYVNFLVALRRGKPEVSVA